MRIVQITDLHVGLADEATFDVDVRANFLGICQKTRALAPDYIVVSGDLCFEQADPEIYRWIKQHLDSLEITYDLLSGNHDNPRTLAKSFDCEHLLQDGELYYQRQLEGFPYLFLDTTTGMVSKKQLDWLDDALKHQGGPVIIFMHHPPLLAGVPHMDRNYALKNREEVLDILLAHNQRIDIFCGHYHVDKTISIDNLNVHITPSCFFQIDQHSEEFAVDHYRPALREIDATTSQLSHTVIFL
ncbi:metallophosphoesterase [Flavilitoribacter nigricans]|nr:metallophosphoesterase [Flavilitoribacter nigricans]